MDDSHVSGLHGCEESSILESRDRLSELPNSLILEILSLLPMRDVVKTTLLSRRWKDLWNTIPCLDFSNSPNDSDLYKFRRFVSGALGNWKGVKIRKFNITLWRYYNSFVSDIYDSWLFFSVEKQVEDLDISYRKDSYFRDFRAIDYDVPQFLYSCSSFKKLSLVSFKVNIDKNVQWNQLKSLMIQAGEPLSDVSLNHILSGAPHLEVLDLSFSVIVENLIINIGSTSLKMLKIHTMRDIPTFLDGVHHDALLRIQAPNLDTLDISGVGYRMCVFDLDVPSLTTAIVDFSDMYMRCQEILRHVLVSILHVQKLTLSYTCIFEEINSAVEGAEPEIFLSHILSGAPNLEVLNLSLDNRRDLNIRSTSLKMLKIYCSPYTRADNTMLRIWAPNLETLEILGFPNRKFLLNAPSLTNAILVFDHITIALQEMLGRLSQSILNHVEKVTLSDSCTEVLLRMKKYRKIPSNAKFLKLISASAPIKILGVVEMFPQLTMLVIECNERMRPFGDQSGALDTRISCRLLQYLKTVEITWPLHDPSIYLVIEILLKNAQMLEKMVFGPLKVSSPESLCLAEEKVRRMPRSSPTAVLSFINKN